MSAIGLFFSVFWLLFRLMAAFAVLRQPRSLGSPYLSASSSFSPQLYTHTHTQTAGQDRIALSSVLKGQTWTDYACSHRGARVHVTSPRNSLTAKTGTESDYRYRSCCSSPLLDGFLLILTPEGFFLGRLVTDCWTL